MKKKSPEPVIASTEKDVNLPIPRSAKTVTIDDSRTSSGGPIGPLVQPTNGSAITPERLYFHRQSRFNPIKNLNPQSLTSQFDSFDLGVISPLARTMEKIAEADECIKSNIVKRKAAVSRMAYKIIIDPDIDESQQGEAEDHAAALRYFYKNCKVSHAVEKNQKGGFSLLVRQMLDSVSYKYTVHELLWKPVPGQGLTCTFNCVPLYFFENRPGELRYLPFEGAFVGLPLEQDCWMITVGDFLMRAAAVCYMYKTLSLRDWVAYNEKFGMPLPVVKTLAPKGSPQHDAYEDALTKLGPDGGLIMGPQDEFTSVTFGGAGTLPHPELVERMDRFISILYRGGDLATLSQGGSGAAGSNPQQEDTMSLEQYDAQNLTETLNQWIDTLVIRHQFGADVQPLAFIKISAPDRKDIGQEIEINKHMLEMGLPLHKKDTYEGLNRTMPDGDTKPEDLVMPPEPDKEEAGKAGAKA